MNYALIPVRGGSKSIPLKNIKIFCGKPLVYWTIKAACTSKYIDYVFVCTDSEEIKRTVEELVNENYKELEKVRVIDRSPETATDFASTESVMLEFANKTEFDNLILIQATSPLLTSEDLDKGFEIFNEDGTDSVLSAVKQKRFNWSITESGYAVPLNYDVYNRPRRQNFDGYYVENGAFYITSKKALLESKNRISGKIKVSEMPEDTFFEIDEPSDWIIMENLMFHKLKNKPLDLSKIKVVLSDCDGCLTDGGMYYSEFGDELKKFSTKDGVGFELIKRLGIYTGIITGEIVSLNSRRAQKLNLDFFYQGCKDKLKVVKEICEQIDCTLDNVLYVGDEINDFDTLSNVGISVVPNDACSEVASIADYKCKTNGGKGVIRELAYILIAQRNNEK